MIRRYLSPTWLLVGCRRFRRKLMIFLRSCQRLPWPSLLLLVSATEPLYIFCKIMASFHLQNVPAALQTRSLSVGVHEAKAFKGAPGTLFLPNVKVVWDSRVSHGETASSLCGLAHLKA